MVRGEKIMPTPAGDITGSNIWTGEPSEDKKYKVTVTYKIRRVMLVSAKSAAEIGRAHV